MKPTRADIAAPPFPPGIDWVGGAEPRLERLVADGPLLVHFYDLAQLNSVRALPYLEAWHERYAPAGLSVLGVHSSRYGFTGRIELIGASRDRLGIEWPVAVDSQHTIWRAYGCRGWPSLFLWSQGGALRWYHLGEGEYEATELAIREALEEAGYTPGREAEEVGGKSGPWPEALAPVRPGDEPGARVMAPTPELLPGGAAGSAWGEEDGVVEVSYDAGGAYVAADGEGELLVTLDGETRDPVQIRHSGLHVIALHESHESHDLELQPGPGVRLFSVQFAPAPPP